MPYQNPNAPLLEGFGNLGAALMLAPKLAAKNKQAELDRADRARREDDALARSLRGELASYKRHADDMKNANEQKGFDRDLQRELYGQKQEAAGVKAAQAKEAADARLTQTFAPQYVMKGLEDQYPDPKERFAKTFDAGINPNNGRMVGPGNDILPEADPSSPNAWQRGQTPVISEPEAPTEPMRDLPLREALHIGGKGARKPSPMSDEGGADVLPDITPDNDSDEKIDLLGNALQGNPPPVPQVRESYPQPTSGAPRLEPVSKKGREAARMEAANPNTPAPDPTYVKSLVGLSSTNPVKLKSLLVELKNRNLSEYQAVAKALREHANAQ